MKQAILSFGKAAVLLVCVPDKYRCAYKTLNENDNWIVVFKEDPDSDGLEIVNFHHEEPKLLGKLSELTEEQCKDIVDCYGIGCFHNYKTESQYDELLHTTARESFFSKLKADGYFTINPYAKTKMSFSGFNAAEKEQVKELFKKRKESGDARTFPPDQTYVFIITKPQS